MKNVNEYCRENKISYRKIHSFLILERVRYLIKLNNLKFTSVRGRYGGTLFDRELFDIFVQWTNRIPIPLLNRKEYEVDVFLDRYFGENIISQYESNGRVYDWYIPSQDLLIEFDERHHSTNKRSENKDVSRKPCFIIREATVMEDLADLVKSVGRV